jgi:hypothetical protein
MKPTKEDNKSKKKKDPKKWKDTLDDSSENIIEERKKINKEIQVIRPVDIKIKE